MRNGWIIQMRPLPKNPDETCFSRWPSGYPSLTPSAIMQITDFLWNFKFWPVTSLSHLASLSVLLGRRKFCSNSATQVSENEESDQFSLVFDVWSIDIFKHFAWICRNHSSHFRMKMKTKCCLHHQHFFAILHSFKSVIGNKRVLLPGLKKERWKFLSDLDKLSFRFFKLQTQRKRNKD